MQVRPPKEASMAVNPPFAVIHVTALTRRRRFSAPPAVSKYIRNTQGQRCCHGHKQSHNGFHFISFGKVEGLCNPKSRFCELIFINRIKVSISCRFLPASFILNEMVAV